MLFGKNLQPLRAREQSSQNCSEVETSPGKRHPIPTMAIGDKLSALEFVLLAPLVLLMPLVPLIRAAPSMCPLVSEFEYIGEVLGLSSPVDIAWGAIVLCKWIDGRNSRMLAGQDLYIRVRI